MADPASILVAKVLDSLLGKLISEGVDALKGSASKALQDSANQLTAERQQRAERMAAIVLQAGQSVQTALAQAGIDADQGVRDLFAQPDFLAQVVRSLLLGVWPDLDRLQPVFQKLFGERATELEEPLLIFYQNLDTLISQDDIWGPVVRQFRLEARLKRLDEHALQINEAALLAVASIDTLPVRIVEAAETHQRERLEALERAYLRGLYAECNELPLAGDAPPDASLHRRPRLQEVYVDLDVDRRPDFERVLNRLGVEKSKRAQVKSVLERLSIPELGQSHLAAGKKLARQLSHTSLDEMFANPSEGQQALEKLDITKEALVAALRPVAALEAIHDHPQLVLLGDPGSGKTTLTRRLAGMLAAVAVDGLPADETDWETNLDGTCDRWLLPVRVVLSRWAAHLPDNAGGNAGDLIAECRRLLAQTVGETGVSRLEELFVERLNAAQPTVLLLLDGLDEVAGEEQRKLLLAAVRDFCASYSAVRLIVTCRVRPYLEGEHFRLPLPEMKLAPLSEDSIKAFLVRWYDELAWAGIYDQTADPARHRLQGAIDDPTRSELREMAETPLLLTIMARVNYKKGLPDSRAMLYEDYVEQLLWEWERKRQDDPGQPTVLESLLKQAGVNRVSLERALNELAYKVHGQQGSRDTVDIPRWQMRETIEAIHPDRQKGADWALQVLDLIDYRSGLIRSLKKGEIYQFTHRTFQEYLAARWMAGHGYRTKFDERIDDDNWREAILLALGYQIFKLGDFDSALTVINEQLPERPQDPSQWRRVVLMGEGYASLLTPQRAREAEGQKVAQQVMADVPRLLTTAMQNRHLPPRQRLEAGLLLADLDVDPPGLDEFVPVPGAGFSIGRYPVTNTQFRRFMDDGGYELDKPWWTKETIAELRSIWGDDWVKGSRFWDNRRFNRSTQPVVGVSWYEAVAYCAWLTEKLRTEGKNVEARLPTVEEWQRAAGSQTYPWGPTFDPSYANTKESGLDQSTPVHMYPNGVRRFAAAAEVWDMAGNVWEWTGELYTGVSFEAYVLVGGAYWNDASGVGTAARDGDLPRGWFGDGGFRVVVVPVSRP